MGIPIKSESEIAAMRAGGKILAEVLEKTCEMAKPGVSTYELDQFAENLIRERGGKPTFKGYNGFPATLCTAIDEVIVHGIPRKDEFLKDGDLFTVDCGVEYQGMHTDAARSIGIGEISKQKQKLVKVAWEALGAAIDTIKPGIRLNEIGETIQEVVEKAGFHIIYDLTGHGIGKELHESPVICNFAQRSSGPKLEAGMTFAIEPIFSVGTSQMRTLNDDWTIVTADGSCSVQVENTILITPNGAEVLTQN